MFNADDLFVRCIKCPQHVCFICQPVILETQVESVCMIIISHMDVSHGFGYVGLKMDQLFSAFKLLNVQRSHDTILDLSSDYESVIHIMIMCFRSNPFWKSLFSSAIHAKSFLPCATTSYTRLSFRRRKGARCSIPSNSVTSVLGDTDKKESFILYLSMSKVTTKNSYKR